MRVGSLCTGYGGLDIAVDQVLGGKTVWISDVDKYASSLIAERFPNVPNIGDLTTVDWRELEPIDVLTAGFPCQPFSHAGNRKGETDDRHLWPYIATAIRVLRPRYVVLENVRGHLTLGFDRVLGDLAGIGFDVEWAVVSAAQVGACHKRERLFIVAADADAAGSQGQEPTQRRHLPTGGATADTSGGQQSGPTVTNHGLPESGELLPTPTPFTNSNTEQPGEWLQRRADVVERTGTHHGLPLAVAAQSITDGTPISQANPMESLCKPSANPAETTTQPSTYALPVSTGRKKSAANSRDISRKSTAEKPTTIDKLPTGSPNTTDFGMYAAAVNRWAGVIGRPPPDPTSGGRLNPVFVEWMMGLPEGWVTGLDISHTQQLKLLGNGVVPQQAAGAVAALVRRLP